MKFVFFFFSFLFSINIAATAHNYKKHSSVHFEKKEVTADDTLVITNVFGNVTVRTWNKNKVVVNVSKNAVGTTKEEAKMILNSITISSAVNEPRKMVLKTTINTGSNNHEGVNAIEQPITGQKIRYASNVNYVIDMPKNMALSIHNVFGDVELGDLSGKLDVTIIHGGLTAQNLSGPYKTISVEDTRANYFSNIGDNTIQSIEYGDLTCEKDANLVIRKAIDTSKVHLKGWSKVTIDP